MAKQDGLVGQSTRGITQRKTILVMDDQIERHDMFLRFIGDGFDSIYTAETMLTMVEAGAVNAEVLFLDHDLGVNMNGSNLVDEMVKQHLELPTVKRIYVHSANIGGNHYMVRKLQEEYPDIQVTMSPITWLSDEFRARKQDRKAFKDFILGE